MSEQLGIGKALRKQFSTILRHTGEIATPAGVAHTLDIPLKQAANILGRLEARGWMMRMKRGVYHVIPLDAQSVLPVIEDPWSVADKLFAPCYIGGWTAAHHWGFTDQLFTTTVVVTAKRQQKNQAVKGALFLLKVVKQDRFFGLEKVWQDKTWVMVSDPSRTIVDILCHPRLAGGMRMAMDMLGSYLRSEYYDSTLLIDYGKRLGNGTFFKRLGFLLERLAPDQLDVLKACKGKLTLGYSQLEPGVKGEVAVAKWRLYVPKGF